MSIIEFVVFILFVMFILPIIILLLITVIELYIRYYLVKLVNFVFGRTKQDKCNYCINKYSVSNNSICNDCFNYSKFDEDAK